MSSPQEIRAVAENAVVVFSKSWCPYSKKAKDLLKTHYPEVQPAIYELDEKEDGGKAYQDYLEGKTGQRTVPNIFIRQQHIGGSSHLVALHDEDGIRALLK
ncbi:thioredoxin-like protein [Russula ochroleuca]|uniref:Thioredoxin-like protein n=1 Tax=Russula ochroleuca TaxID=152965 RepID=A0A9P5TAR8_9AGAM|nr:thioredoxin-like protein [Russula ochroleuca]